MKHIVSLLCLSSLAACALVSNDESPTAAARATPPSGVLPLTVERATLANGLKVLLVPMPTEGLASYWSVVRTGSRDEIEPGMSGFAHFFEHMMFRGTPLHPQYDLPVNGMGASANASTSEDQTVYHLALTRESLPQAIELEADRFQHLAYAESAFKTEAGAVYGEYRKDRTSPASVLEEAVQNAAFDQHTYKHTTIGFEADIQAMPTRYEYSKSFFQRFYRPENVVILVTGDFDPSTTLAQIEKAYAGWKPGYVAPAVPREPRQTAERQIDVEFDDATPVLLSFNWKCPAYDPGDREAVAGGLVGELAFGPTSEFYKRFVLTERKLIACRPSFGDSRDPGLWSLNLTLRNPADAHGLEDEVWKAASAFATSEVEQKRLDDLRSNRKYAFLGRLDSPDSAAGTLARTIALSGDLFAVDVGFETLATLTAEDVRAAAQRFLKHETCTVATLHQKGKPVPAAGASQASAGRADVHASEASAAKAASAASAATEPAPAAGQSLALKEAPVLLHVADDQAIALKIWFKTGSQDDPPGKEGLASLTAALIAEGGTRNLAYAEIVAQLFPLAASWSARVDKEMCVFSANVHKDNLEPFAKLFASALVEPGFRPDDFERLRTRRISRLENELRFSSDEELAKAALYETIFHGTPYEHLGEGTVSALKALTLDDVRAFARGHFTRENLVLGLGGAFSSQFVKSFGEQLLRLPGGSPLATPKSNAAALHGRHVTIVSKNKADTAISLGFPIDVKRGSREFCALWIANSWLGEHRNSISHLYQVIRDARGMNYGDYSYIEAFPQGGMRSMPPTGVGRRSQIFEMWLRPVPADQGLFALRAGLRELEHLVQNGLTAEQFEYQRGALHNYCLHFAETTAERLGYALDDRFYGLSGHLASFQKQLDSMTLEEVNAAIKKHLQTANLEIALVAQDAEDLKQAIAAERVLSIRYPKDIEKPAAILAEDKEIESWKLGVPLENIRIVPAETMFAGTPRADG